MKEYILGTSLIQRKYATVMANAQALLHQDLMDEKSIYDDLNCGKLVKMINIRVKEIMGYAELLRANQGNRVSDNCHYCPR